MGQSPEGKIVSALNKQHNTHYKLKDLMEWSTSKEWVERYLKEDEIMLKCDFYSV